MSSGLAFMFLCNVVSMVPNKLSSRYGIPRPLLTDAALIVSRAWNGNNLIRQTEIKQNTHSSSADRSDAVKFSPCSTVVVNEIFAVQFTAGEGGVSHET